MSNQLTKVAGEKHLYFHNPTGNYYLRKRENDVDTHVCLNTTRVGVARKLRDDWVNAKTNEKLGIITPEERKKPVPVTTILDDYVKDQYPDRRGNARTGERHLRSEKAAVPLLRDFFKQTNCDQLDQSLLDDYYEWRKKNISRGTGARTTDLELNTLGNALNWAVRKKHITANPIPKKVRFHSYTKARHCKDLSPTSPEELHAIAKVLFSEPRSEVLGWQCLWEAYSGMRTEESIRLGYDAGPGEPGHVTGESMLVRRADKAARSNLYVHLHQELQDLLTEFRKWHQARYPLSTWMFPGRDKKVGEAISLDALTAALSRLYKTKFLKRKFTSHGMRAYYVLCRRSNGIHDSQIAVELNQLGGLETLRTSYGMIPPHWLDGQGPKLKFTPSEPAWKSLKECV